MLPATITIAPNSPMARAKLSSAPLARGRISGGRVMRRKIVQPLAPRVVAASSWVRSRSISTGWTARTTKGKVMNSSARMIPGGAKMIEKPSWSFSQAPSACCGPKRITSITPVTRVGIASGRSIMLLRIDLPGNS